MTVSQSSSSAGANRVADYCVVGSGPAGLTVAERLAATGATVTVLEQGPRYGIKARGELIQARRDALKTRDMDFDYASTSKLKNAEPTSAKLPYTYLSLSAVGGASLHWDGQTPRLTEEDMRARSLYGYARDWPISYAELEPWVLKAEHLMGVSANADNPYASKRSGDFSMPAHPRSFYESEILAPAMKKLGWTPHSCAFAIASKSSPTRSACLGCRSCTVCPSGARYAADRVMLPLFLKHPGAQLLSEHKLRRLELDAAGKAVAVAHAVDAAGKDVALRAKRFILAMGGVETPRMLLLSKGKGHQAGIGNHEGMVGRGFSDHMMSFFRYITPKPVGHSLGFPSVHTEHFRGPSAREGISSFSLQTLPIPVTGDYVQSPELVERATHKKVLSLGLLRNLVRRGVIGWSIHEHSGTGLLTLDEAKNDSYGDPVPKISLEASERDLAGLRARDTAAAKLGEAMDAEYGGSTGEAVIWASHPSGATAMARSPKEGVCDSNLRVFGTKNLYVLGSCTFPHSGANNPTLTIVALALRLAAQLEGGKR